MKKPKNVTAKLWGKLNPSQQKKWVSLHKQFYDELNTLSQLDNDVKAHNLAFIVIWGDKT